MDLCPKEGAWPKDGGLPKASAPPCGWEKEGGLLNVNFMEPGLDMGGGMDPSALDVDAWAPLAIRFKAGESRGSSSFRLKVLEKGAACA